jgi:hypothetical protein
MSQETKTIDVDLVFHEEEDLLVFHLSEDFIVDLNSEDSSHSLKTVFSALLQDMLVQPIELKLNMPSEDNGKGLYIEVCTEYIRELNREIRNVYSTIPKK